jgi:hypothetical protein
MSDLASYAPATPSRDARVTVLLSGLLTTALALFGVYLLATRTDGFNIMGWYGDYVLPIGALLVGLVAASGYSIASWVTGQKITKSLLWMVLALQAAAWLAGQYIEFRSGDFHYKDGTPVSFVTYFDYAARSFAWQDDNGQTGEPLGAWGYGLRLLELAGFCGGSLLVPLALKKSPYCESCQTYMKTRQVVTLPASAPFRRVKKSDATALAAYQNEQREAADKGHALLTAFGERATAGNADGFLALVAEHKAQTTKNEKLPARVALSLARCPKCSGGYLKSTLRTGHGKQIQQKEIGRNEVSPSFMRLVNG